MIYINGYWNRVTGFLGLSPSTPDESYWNFFSPTFISSSLELMGTAADETNSFIDGSSYFGIDQSANDRYTYGYKYAQEHYRELVNGLKPGGSFKFVSHSEGGAFAAGMADFIIASGGTVEWMLYLSPHQAAAFNSPVGVFAIQVHFINDPICISKRINGVNVFINLRNLNGKKAGLRYAHGGTVKESTIKNVLRILEKVPHQGNTTLIEGQWTITETTAGNDFKREVET